jgi:hypothetical protein
MALTLVSSPAAISNSGAYNITTSLVEDSTHVNLRVRADVYHEGIVKATVEKPKGIAGYDFFDILKSLVPGLLFAKDSGSIVNTGTAITELITSWADKDTTFGTLTTAANVINSAICTTSSIAQTNTITMAIGELYLFYSNDFTTSGANEPRVYLSSGGATESVVLTKKGILLMPTSNATLRVYLGHQGNMNFSGTFHLYRIWTDRGITGNPIAPYFVTFTEIYEDASGVTQAGTPLSSQLKRFVPAIGNGTAFSNYVLTIQADPNTYLFANKTLRNNAIKFFTVTSLEYWVSFFTEYCELTLFYIKDSDLEPVGNGTAHQFLCGEGWGVVILNIGELMASVTNKLCFRIGTIGGSLLSEKVSIYIDSSSLDERTVLEFDGLVGGKEYLAFEGLKDIQFVTQRDYFTGASKNKKSLKFSGVNRQRLETRFKDINNASYLKSLLLSENVKKLLPSYATPLDVTIITDAAKIENSELFTNQIEIEYED